MFKNPDLKSAFLESRKCFITHGESAKAEPNGVHLKSFHFIVVYGRGLDVLKSATAIGFFQILKMFYLRMGLSDEWDGWMGVYKLSFNFCFTMTLYLLCMYLHIYLKDVTKILRISKFYVKLGVGLKSYNITVGNFSFFCLKVRFLNTRTYFNFKYHTRTHQHDIKSLQSPFGSRAYLHYEARRAEFRDWMDGMWV